MNPTMKRESNIVDIDSMLNDKFGAVGTESRSEFRKEAYNYCIGQLIMDARKQEGFTQTELADKLGVSKSYISRVEKGQIEPGVGIFFRMINALGLRLEIVKTMFSSTGVHQPVKYLSDSDAPSYSSK